jgi:hypothetical protein
VIAKVRCGAADCLCRDRRLLRADSLLMTKIGCRVLSRQCRLPQSGGRRALVAAITNGEVAPKADVSLVSASALF